MPFSTAPPTVDLLLVPKEQLLLSITGIVIIRLEQSYIDQYKPGIARERGYIRGMSSLYKNNHMELPTSLADSVILDKTQDCIKVEVLEY